jgi:hypothetical protein
MQQDDLIAQFKFPITGFSSPIKWQDGFGFSVTQKYRNSYASLYKIGVYDEKQKEGDLKKLWISVIYGKEAEGGGISIGTGKKGVWNPVDLDFRDEYFFNLKTKKFFHFEKEIDPKNILFNVEKLHKLPTKSIRGILLRLRLRFWRIFLPSIIKIIDKCLILLLLFVSGEGPKDADILKRLVSQWHDGHVERADQRPGSRNPPFEPVSFNKGTPLDFFGYKAKRWSVVFYCLMNLFLYILFFYWEKKPDWLAYISNPLTNILRNNFLALCYVVVSFAITEALVPSALKIMIERVPKVFRKVSFKILKVHNFW